MTPGGSIFARTSCVGVTAATGFGFIWINKNSAFAGPVSVHRVAATAGPVWNWAAEGLLGLTGLSVHHPV